MRTLLQLAQLLIVVAVVAAVGVRVLPGPPADQTPKDAALGTALEQAALGGGQTVYRVHGDVVNVVELPGLGIFTIRSGRVQALVLSEYGAPTQRSNVVLVVSSQALLRLEQLDS